MMDVPSTIFWCVFFALWLVYLFSSYLDIRQRRVYQNTKTLPKEAEHLMDEETFQKSRLYSLDKKNYSLIKGFYDMVQVSIILYFNVMPWLWLKCVAWMNDFGWNGREYEVTTSMLYMTIVILFMFVEGLPWSVYYHFILEERHGFNKQTATFFIKDTLKGIILSFVLALPLTAAILHIIHWGGPHFYVYVWSFVFLFSIFMMFIYPDFIAPLFDRYVTLPEGELKTEIETMAASIQFPLTKLYVVEGSKRSNHSNAYLYGFWKNKRIVLFDTLIEGFVMPPKEGEQPPQKEESKSLLVTEKEEEREKIRRKGCQCPEILAVLGHELGHWKKSHVWCHMILSEINLFIMFFAFGLLLNNHTIYAAFGFSEEGNVAPTLLRLMIVFQFIFMPYSTLLQCFTTWLTRCMEFQADRFAVEEMRRGEALKTALIKLGKDNLSFPVNDTWYSAFNFDHPPVIERARAIDSYIQKMK
jgi:STE24 endopeptidase